MENLIIEKSALGNSTRKTDIKFYRNGRVDINAYLSRLIGLESGDVIDIATSKGEYYFFIRSKHEDTRGRHEAQVFATNKGKRTHNYRTYSKRITSMFFDGIQGNAINAIAGQLCEFSNIGKAAIIIPKIQRYG